MGEYGYPVQQLSAGVIYVDGFRECGVPAGSRLCISRGIVMRTIKQEISVQMKLF
jgi:hypothetical protein